MLLKRKNDVNQGLPTLFFFFFTPLHKTILHLHIRCRCWADGQRDEQRWEHKLPSCLCRWSFSHSDLLQSAGLVRQRENKSRNRPVDSIPAAGLVIPALRPHSRPPGGGEKRRKKSLRIHKSPMFSCNSTLGWVRCRNRKKAHVISFIIRVEAVKQETPHPQPPSMSPSLLAACRGPVSEKLCPESWR